MLPCSCPSGRVRERHGPRRKRRRERFVDAAPFAESPREEANPYPFGFATPKGERVVFRTGISRMQDFSRYAFSARAFKRYEPDLPGADEPVARTVVDVDNLRTKTARP